MSEPVNRCRLCGATSYRRVVQRDERGVLVAGPRYVCSGCGMNFSDPRAWREGALAASGAGTARTASAHHHSAGHSVGRLEREDNRALVRLAWSS
jgi:hypothetical protein